MFYLLAKSLYPEHSIKVFKAQWLAVEQKAAHLPRLSGADNMKQAWQEGKEE